MKKLILSLAAVAALASCATNENETPTTNYDLNEIRVSSQALEATTKAPFEGSTIDATDHVLLAYVPTTITENNYTTLYNSGNSGDYIKFTNNQATGFCDATGNTPQPKYYPASGEVWICGLFPAAGWTSLSETATHSIEGNTDIMAAAQKKSVKGGEVQTLAFKHLLTKLNITFIAETGAATQWGDVTKIGSVGLLLALHWIFFYGSIKASNVSIGVVCLSLMSIFTAIFEPLINRHRISFREILFSLVAVLGIVLIFHFDTRYRVGICMGVISSALASLFTIVNKKVAVNYTSSTMLLYEMLGGFLGLSCILPAYLHYFPVPSILPGAQDLIYLLCLASVCTVGLYILQIQVLKVISAFTVNLSYNLEPIYSIIGAMLIFQEAKDLNFSFYLGLGLIVLSVVLQTLNVLSQHHKFIPSLYVKWKR